MKPFRTVAVGVAVAALALPAAALAHPGVYTSKQLAYEAAAPYNDACRITDAVGNDPASRIGSARRTRSETTGTRWRSPRARRRPRRRR